MSHKHKHLSLKSLLIAGSIALSWIPQAWSATPPKKEDPKSGGSKGLTATGSNRLGLSVGAITWGSAEASVEYDHLGFFPTGPHWTGGLGFSLIETGFLLSSRVLYWQNPTSFSGFYGGPKVAIGAVDSTYYSDHNNSMGDGSSLLIGIGGEGGYSYRIPRRPDIDVLGSVEVLLTDYGMMGSLKVGVGYTF